MLRYTCNKQIIRPYVILILLYISKLLDNGCDPNIFRITEPYRSTLRIRLLQGRKEIYYLTTHSTHFILHFYMVKDHSDSERGNLLPPHGRLTARFFLYAPSHRQDSTYHGLCYTSRGALAGTRNSSMGPHHEGLIRPSPTNTHM